MLDLVGNETKSLPIPNALIASSCFAVKARSPIAFTTVEKASLYKNLHSTLTDCGHLKINYYFISSLSCDYYYLIGSDSIPADVTKSWQVSSDSEEAGYSYVTNQKSVLIKNHLRD